MPKMKIKFSDKVIRKPRYESAEIKHLFKPNNFIFTLKESPQVHLRFYRMSRKEATNRAIQMAPGCTFDIKEFNIPL